MTHAIAVYDGAVDSREKYYRDVWRVASVARRALCKAEQQVRGATVGIRSTRGGEGVRVGDSRSGLPPCRKAEL